MHFGLQKAAKTLGGTVNKQGQVVLEQAIAIALAELLANIEEKLMADTVPLTWKAPC